MDSKKLSEKAKRINKKRAKLLIFVDDELRNNNTKTKINSLSFQDFQQRFSNDFFIEFSSNYSSFKTLSDDSKSKVNFKSLSDKNFIRVDKSQDKNKESDNIDTDQFTTSSIKKKRTFNNFNNDRMEYYNKLNSLAISLKKNLRCFSRKEKSLQRVKVKISKKTNSSHFIISKKSQNTIKSYELINDLCDDVIKRYNNQELKLSKTTSNLNKDKEEIKFENLRSFLFPVKKKKNLITLIKMDSI